MCVFIFIIIAIILSLFHCLLICRFYRMVLCIYCNHVCSYPRQISQFIVETSYLILFYLGLVPRTCEQLFKDIDSRKEAGMSYEVRRQVAP